MNEKYRNQWEKLGSSDPYWAVLSDPSKKGNKWERADFFESGEAEIGKVFSTLGTIDAVMNFDTAMDFGCGVGRLSRALSKKFRKVIAVDLSSSMLVEAKSANQHIENIDFIHNTVENLKVVPDNSVDFLYSNIVLQHMPPKKQIIFIKEFCRVLHPSGVIVFQTPSMINLKTISGWIYMLLGNKILNILRKIKYGPEGVMELHTLTKKRVLNILHHMGMEIQLVEKDNSAGSAFESYKYYAKRKY